MELSLCLNETNCFMNYWPFFKSETVLIFWTSYTLPYPTPTKQHLQHPPHLTFQWLVKRRLYFCSFIQFFYNMPNWEMFIHFFNLKKSQKHLFFNNWIRFSWTEDWDSDWSEAGSLRNDLYVGWRHSHLSWRPKEFDTPERFCIVGDSNQLLPRQSRSWGKECWA